MKVAESLDKRLEIFYVLSAICLLLVFVFNGLASVPDSGIFLNTISNVSDTYSTPITPAGYTFAIWGIIYFFQAAWMLYALISLCRKTKYGSLPVYKNPVILPATFHIFYILASGCNIGFLFTFDREKLIGAAVTVIFNMVFIGICLVINCKLTLKYRDQILSQSRVDLILIYVLIQNGLDFYFTWTVVASHLSISIVLIHSDVSGIFLDPNTTATIMLCVLLILIIVLNLLGFTMFLDLFKYVYAGYFVLIWAFIGILVENYEKGSTNSILVIVGIVVTAIFCAAKISVTVYKGKRGERAFAVA